MYSSKLFLISSRKRSFRVPLRSPSSLRCGKYVTKSEMRARERRRAFAFGSFARKGLIGVRGVVEERDCSGVCDDTGVVACGRGILGGTGSGPPALGGRTAARGPVPDVGRPANGGRAGGIAG